MADRPFTWTREITMSPSIPTFSPPSPPSHFSIRPLPSQSASGTAAPSTETGVTSLLKPLLSMNTTHKPLWRYCCSLHVIFVVVLLVCVVITTGTAWIIAVTVAERNASELAEKVTRTNVQIKKDFILTSLKDSMYFANVDQLWAEQLVKAGVYIDYAFLETVAWPRFISRHLSGPSCSASGMGTSEDVFVGVMVEQRGTPQERWISLASNGTGAAFFTKVIQPLRNGQHTIIKSSPPQPPLNVSTRQFFVEAKYQSAYERIYFSGATSLPYLFVGTRIKYPMINGDIVFVNGIRTDQFSGKMKENLAEGSRLYIVERSARGALLVASHGFVHQVVGDQAVPIPAVTSPDPLIQSSAQSLLNAGNQKWTQVPSYSKHRLSDGNTYFILAEILRVDGLDYVLVELTLYSNIMGEVTKATSDTITICSCLLAFDCIAVIISAILLARPLSQMNECMANLAKLNFEDSQCFHQHKMLITQLSTIKRSLKKLHNGIQSFARYVPQELLHHLINHPEHRGTFIESRELTVMFCDMVKFTELCHQQHAHGLLQIMTQYFDAISEAVSINHGTIDKYIGDCVMAMWNAPQMVEQHQRCAINAVLQIHRSLRALQHALRPITAFELDFRIGVHTASVLVGAFGSSVRLSYTCVGAGVNIAARLQPMNGELGTRTLVSSETAQSVPDVIFRYLGTVRLLGSRIDLDVYEPLVKAVTVSIPPSSTETSINPLSPQMERVKRDAVIDGGGLLMPRTNSREPILTNVSRHVSEEELAVGTGESTDICELFGAVAMRQTVADYAQSFSSIVRMYNSAKFVYAHQLLLDLLSRRFGTDGALDVLRHKIEAKIDDPPVGEWTGVVIQTYK